MVLCGPRPGLYPGRRHAWAMAGVRLYSVSPLPLRDQSSALRGFWRLPTLHAGGSPAHAPQPSPNNAAVCLAG